MDKIDTAEYDASEASVASNSFVFSKPSIIFDSPKVINFGLGSDHVFDTRPSKKDVFTFAIPTIVSGNNSDYVNLPVKKFIKRKPKTAYKPTVNVFANALKDTEAFEQLKKNSRSQPTKIDVNNSITCSNVPKALLTKTAAKEYFTKYGNIVKITIRPQRRIIIVAYTSKKEANNAYYNIGNYMGETFHVEWSGSSAKSPIKRKTLQKNIVTNLLTSTDDEIKAELEAMSNLEYNLYSSKGTEPSNTGALFSIKTKTSAGKLAALPKLEKVKTVEKAAKVAEKSMKVEKPDVESQIAKLLPTTSIEELQNIIHQVALTAEEKHKVLEARDRLMRLKRVKPASLATAKVTSGTCRDMCPEKERLMRESQRQVASYEQLDGNEYRINHATAVKQYSRSSADQEEPMPHELRPVKSLKMTMSYLLHEIMDLCEQEGTNLAEWYHFLWDRTRGIRKDITQQELCCVNSVELVEQCARFHIVCSERLCAEDASVFDKKINSENLTKCLQTLKYMYEDLRVKGIICENEPEFRAYVVLLNLNNGNFLYDLQQLPKSVQNSPEIQFAIKMYFSLDSNNYYKFFKLVRETTYLNACILLRYFNQVRLKAFSIMIKAYCRSVSTAFPLYELIDILGFEDENEAKHFCEQVGLNLSADELHVLLNRQNFNISAASLRQTRACNLIESKRIVLNYSIGQCIAGGKMPEKTYRNHKPHNSFDAHGNLRPESINAEDQSTDVSPVKQYDPYEFTEDTPKKIPKLTSIRERVDRRTAKDFAPVKKQPASSEAHVFKSVSFFGSNVPKTLTSDPDTSVEQKAQGTLENKYLPLSSSAQVKLPAADKQSGDENTNKQQPSVFGNINFASPFASNPTAFSKQPEGASRNAESTAPFAMTVTKNIFSGTGSGTNIFMKNATTTSASSTLFAGNSCFSTQQSGNADAATKVTKEQKGAMSEAEKVRLEKLEHTRRMQRLDEQSEEIYNSLHAEVTRELCSAVAREDIDRIKMYDTVSARILGDMIDQVTREMCDAVLSMEVENQQKLQAMLLKIKNRVILKCFNVWKQYVSKRKRQRKALEDTPVWLQRQSVEECARMLYSKQQKIVMRNMRMRPSEPTEDAATATISTSSEKPIEVIAYAGIRENLRLLDINPSPDIFWKLVISWPDLSNRTMLWHHKKTMNRYLYPDNFTMDPIIKVHRPNSYETLHVCIRHFEGLISDHNLVGSDALLFIADAAEDRKSVAKRLTRTVSSRQKLMPIPLVFICLGDGNFETKSVVSDLESLLESGHVSEYTVMHEKNLSPEVILNLTKSAVLWLTINRSPPNPLEMDYLHNVYDICLSEELWLR